MVNAPEYELAKFLDKMIEPYIPDHYMLNSTQQFIEKIHKFPIQSRHYLVNFDVTSLLTNVPLQETIDSVADYIFDDENPTIPDMEKDDFIKLLQLAAEGMFLYRDKLYRQIDGVAMGSPLGPTLANFFLAHIESKIFAEHKNYYPKLYCRYVDASMTSLLCLTNKMQY